MTEGSYPSSSNQSLKIGPRQVTLDKYDEITEASRMSDRCYLEYDRIKIH